MLRNTPLRSIHFGPVELPAAKEEWKKSLYSAQPLTGFDVFIKNIIYLYLKDPEDFDASKVEKDYKHQEQEEIARKMRLFYKEDLLGTIQVSFPGNDQLVADFFPVEFHQGLLVPEKELQEVAN